MRLMLLAVMLAGVAGLADAKPKRDQAAADRPVEVPAPPGRPRFAADSRFMTDGLTPAVMETGSRDGVVFMVFEDFSAVVAGAPGQGDPLASNQPKWGIECRDDQMTDVRSCKAHIESWGQAGKPSLLIIRDDTGRLAITVGGDWFPGKPASLRIDEEAPMLIAEPKVGITGPAAEALLEKLRRASRILTRHHQWPNEGFVDRQVPPQGVGLADDYLKWALRKGAPEPVATPAP